LFQVEIRDLPCINVECVEGRMNLISHFPSNVKKIRGRHLPDL